ncbi:hypothetical protein CRG98_016470 [Punica granatum]|uniref:Uncharacterized protein n=1 Tax=Punica granatum TaxID=22663 RepID=A0A2I0K3K8_PUNGR|nr:hypothetical protein CRG98_016470 [Punica granatum]
MRAPMRVHIRCTFPWLGKQTQHPWVGSRSRFPQRQAGRTGSTELIGYPWDCPNAPGRCVGKRIGLVGVVRVRRKTCVWCAEAACTGTEGCAHTTRKDVHRASWGCVWACRECTHLSERWLHHQRRMSWQVCQPRFEEARFGALDVEDWVDWIPECHDFKEVLGLCYLRMVALDQGVVTSPETSEDLWGLERRLSHSIYSSTRNLFLILSPTGARGISSIMPNCN